MPGARKPPSGSQSARDARPDESTLVRLIYGFCIGSPVEQVAGVGRVSTKTARATVLALRARLAQPAFNRWHAAYQKLPTATSADREFLAREGFLDALSGCYDNATCFRNFTLGNRKTRLCRACPLPQAFVRPERVAEGLDVVDTVHAFYTRLGIRGERELDPVTPFRLRLIHTTTVATALAASRTADGRLIRPDTPEFLSVWTLMEMLLADLADQPF